MAPPARAGAMRVMRARVASVASLPPPLRAARVVRRARACVRAFGDDEDEDDGFDPARRGVEDEDVEDEDADVDVDVDGYGMDDEDDDEDEDDEDDGMDSVGMKFTRSMYDVDGEAAAEEDEDAEEDDDDLDLDDDDDDDWDGVGGVDARGSFGDIDLVAGQEELDDVERDVPIEQSRHFVDDSGGLRGRALYVCQLNWWLRVKKMQTYPPSRKEIAEMVERTGVAFEAIQTWYDDQCEAYSEMSLAEQAAYEADCARRQEKLEELVADDFQERSSTHFIEEDIFYDEADLMHESDMDEEPLTLAMEKLEDALKAEEEEVAGDEEGDDDGLDENQIARIYQDGSESNPFLINPKQAVESGHWSIQDQVDSSHDSDDGWLGEGGWDALPHHNAVSAVDGGSLAFVGVLNDEVGSGQTPWLRERALNTRGLKSAVETPSNEIDRDPKRHLGDLSRTMHNAIEIGQEFEATVVAMDLYHGALLDCGTEVDALLPICETDWVEVRDHISIGTTLTVKVTDIRPKWWRFRYPLEVMPTRQDLSLMIKRHPHMYGSPINIYAGETMEEACADAGREVRASGEETNEANQRKEYTIDDIKRMIAFSDRQERKITEYERDLLEAGVDDERTNVKFTQSLEARLSNDDDDEDAYDDEEDALFSEEVESLKSEDIDEDEDEDEEDVVDDEVSVDMRGGSVKVRDEAEVDDDDDDDFSRDDDDDNDDDDPRPSSRMYAR